MAFDDRFQSVVGKRNVEQIRVHVFVDYDELSEICFVFQTSQLGIAVLVLPQIKDLGDDGAVY